MHTLKHTHKHTTTNAQDDTEHTTQAHLYVHRYTYTCTYYQQQIKLLTKVITTMLTISLWKWQHVGIHVPQRWPPPWETTSNIRKKMTGVEHVICTIQTCAHISHGYQATYNLFICMLSAYHPLSLSDYMAPLNLCLFLIFDIFVDI